jgi:hypothetical protein
MSKFRSALVAVGAITDPSFAANEATAARLSTPEVTSQPKTQLAAKIDYALSLMDPGAVLQISRHHGALVVSTHAAVKAALVAAFTGGVDSQMEITASADENDMSADGKRSRLTVTGGVADPAPVNLGTDYGNAVDALCKPKRPSVAFTQLCDALAEIYGEEVEIELVQATGVVRVGLQDGKPHPDDTITALAVGDVTLASLKVGTISLDITEEAAPEGTEEAPAPQFGG